jgi:hypothetical protein
MIHFPRIYHRRPPLNSVLGECRRQLVKHLMMFVSHVPCILEALEKQGTYDSNGKLHMMQRGITHLRNPMIL